MSQAWNYIKISIGWYVLPCAEDDSPLIDKWRTDATRDESKIVEWWTRWPDAQIGIACGLSNLVAFECLDQFAVARFERLASKGGGLGKAVVCSTPSGGMIYVYRAPDATKAGRVVSGSFDRRIRVIGEDGYFIAPGGFTVVRNR